MFRPRVIPVLLLKDKGLVKTKKFKAPVYIGDPMNAVKIFNDLKADELVFLDITASKDNRCISNKFVQNIADEAFMPFAVGGGITTINQIKELLSCGTEKVVINTSLYQNPDMVKRAVSMFGSQSIVASVDVKKNVFGNYKIYIKDGGKKISPDLEEYILFIQELGVGELLLNSIDKDGMMSGYDYDLISRITNLLDIPLIACGGAGDLQDMARVTRNSGSHAAAAGSLFVFHSETKGVLVNYPDQEELNNTFKI